MDETNSKRDELRERIQFFLRTCDQMDETSAWDKQTMGDMDAYFLNDILCTIIRLVAADGNFTPQELSFVSDVMDTKYHMGTLTQIHWQCGDRIQVMLETELPQSIALLQNIHPKLADSFKGIITLLCQTLIATDGIVTEEEAALAKDLIARLA